MSTSWFPPDDPLYSSVFMRTWKLLLLMATIVVLFTIVLRAAAATNEAGELILQATPFKDENDTVFQGNDTTDGLAAAVWTRDISRAHRVARALKAGTVWVNCYGMIDTASPFGGYKQSGFGREGPSSRDRFVHPD
jgi:hypothetical protein